MVRVDIQHNGNRRAELQEGSVELACFCDKNIAVADPRTAADGVQPSADMNAWIFPVFHQNLAQHAGNSGFSVGAADTDRFRKAFHKLAEQDRPLNRRNAESVSFLSFRVFR